MSDTSRERRARRAAVVALPAIFAVATALAFAGSREGARLPAPDWPVFAVCVAAAFAINAAAFVPAWLAKSERHYDLTGSATYLAVLAIALVFGTGDARSRLLAALIAVWALRLGSFLFARIRASGRDARFDAIKLDGLRFFMTWMLQALWVSLTAAAALAAMTSRTDEAEAASLGPIELAGTLVFLVGFATEVVADRQKSRFRAEPANAERFITTGLWARSRHPNYLGEIVLWTGIALVASPALSGWRCSTLVSPFFVHLLLTRISGIPLLESSARRRWGSDPAYCAYLERTPRLWPRLFQVE